MSAPPDRVEQVRRVLAAGGGWNRRSRATLFAWARAEGLAEAELAALLAKALGIRVPAKPGPASPMRVDAASRPSP